MNRFKRGFLLESSQTSAKTARMMSHMNPEKIQNLFIGLLAAGIILLGAGVYVLSNQLAEVSSGVSKIEGGIMDQTAPASEAATSTQDEAMMNTEETMMRSLDRVDLTMTGAEKIYNNLLSRADGWNEDADLASAKTVRVMSQGAILTVPYHDEWGDNMYRVTPYETDSKGELLFGPLSIWSELLGPHRYGSFLSMDKRSQADALADPEYTTTNCSAEPNPAPEVVTIGTYLAVKFQGVTCEGSWVGYEVLGDQANYKFVSAPETNDALLRYVIERAVLM